MANRPKVGDVGTIIDIHMGEDISTAEPPVGYDSIVIEVKLPDKTYREWEAEIEGAMYLRVTTVGAVEGDPDHIPPIEAVEATLPQAGMYYLTPRLKLGNWEGRGDTVPLYVYGIYELP
jgi:hypothetical protein